MGALSKFITPEIKRIVAEQIACCCSNGFGITALNPPVNAPGPNDPSVIFNTATGAINYWDGSAWVTVPSGAGGGSSLEQIGITIDGSGSVITAGVKGYFRVPYGGTITGWTILETSATPIAGSIVVDIWKDTYANYPPTVADTISGSEKPTLASAIKNEDLTLTTWATAVTAGDIFAYNVDSASLVKRVSLFINITRT